MAYCVKCGRKLRNGADFCTNCGARVDRRAHAVTYGTDPRMHTPQYIQDMNRMHLTHQEMPRTGPVYAPPQGVPMHYPPSAPKKNKLRLPAPLMAVVICLIVIVVVISIVLGLQNGQSGQTTANGSVQNEGGTAAGAPSGVWQMMDYSPASGGGMEEAIDQTPMILFDGDTAYLGAGKSSRTVADFEAAVKVSLGKKCSFTYNNGTLTLTIEESNMKDIGKTYTATYDGTYIYAGSGKYKKVG